jgi:outer membrane protein TolC
MGRAQRQRCRELYEAAARALNSLAEERLNLGVETRDELNTARSALERFDAQRCAQPRMEEKE